MMLTLPTLIPGQGMAPTIRELDVSHGTLKTLVAGGHNEHPRHSPDGTSIVWARQMTPRPWQLWTAGTSGEHPRVIAGLRNATEPTFAPGGDQIACISNVTGAADLYVLNRDGGGATRLTRLPAGGHAMEPDWSPDGQEILFGCDIDLATGLPASAPGLWAWSRDSMKVRAVLPRAKQGTWAGQL